ncbi:hypothetical protein WMY93_010330 [Mugilogobius chulae]|uniref:Cadherin domain-containing protein n=1 Tax=Mugilogobius chulae TaxID=88201 RepID=A0AAW0PII3_9GOBI
MWPGLQSVPQQSETSGSLFPSPLVLSRQCSTAPSLPCTRPAVSTFTLPVCPDSAHSQYKFAKQAEMSVSVSITDGRNKVVETARIFVTDANDEAPEFQNLPFIISIPEDTAPGTSVYKVEATDKDMGSGGSVSYALQAASSVPFTIDPHSGVLRVRPGETLDYETTPTHFITDGGGKYKGRHQVLSSSATVTVNLLDSQDMPPVFVGTPYFGYVYEVSVPASELSADGRLLDSDLTTVTVRVVDLNNHPPTFYGENGPQNRFELTMTEHPPAGEILRGFKITVNDSDQGANAKFKLRLVGPSHILRVVPQTVLNEAQVTIIVEDTTGIDYERGPRSLLRFAIHPSSGLISTQPWTSLDAEVRSKYNFYVKAEDSEGKYSLAEVFVTVLDMNDHPPEFNDKLLEKTLVIGSPVKVEAVDEDAESPNNLIEYSIMKADPDNAFDINSETGEIYLKPYIKSMEIVQNITRQKDCTWSLVVQAKDLGSPSFSTTAVVNIDITEAAHLKGPMAAFLMRSRDNPMKAIGMVISVIGVLVGVTAMLSAAMFLRNSKSNKIMPVRRIIKKRPRDPPPQQQQQQMSTWKLKMPLFKFSNPGEKFLVDDNDASGDCEASMLSPRAKAPPPSAPLPPPPPCASRAGDRPRAVPTISGALATKVCGKAKASRRKEGNMSSALVSELKMKLEQKIIESNKGYYC